MGGGTGEVVLNERQERNGYADCYVTNHCVVIRYVTNQQFTCFPGYEFSLIKNRIPSCQIDIFP